MDRRFIDKLKFFLDITARKIGVFLILFIVAFSVYGSYLYRLLSFLGFFSYTYFMACVADERIYAAEKRDVPVSIGGLVLVGVLYLVSIMIIILV